jgi:hypothetical protein
MSIDQITNDLAARQIRQEQAQKTANKKSAANSKANSAYETKGQDQVVFSSKAKQLQETESILRFALEKLETLDEISEDRKTELSGIDSQAQLDNLDLKALSENIIPDQRIAENIKQNKEVLKYVHQIEKLDQVPEEDISSKIDEIQARIESGYYDKPETLNKIADRILDDLLS